MAFLSEDAVHPLFQQAEPRCCHFLSHDIEPIIGQKNKNIRYFHSTSKGESNGIDHHHLCCLGLLRLVQ